MKLLHRLSPGITAVVCAFIGAAPLGAQDSVPLLRKVLLPGESTEAVARLKAADRLIETSESPGLSAALVGIAGSPHSPSFVLTSTSFVGQMVQQDWSAALDEYQRMIYDDGDTLALDEGSDRRLPTLHSLPVRRLCHLRIAATPPHALTLYQKRVDVLAERLFREGQTNRDTKILQRLVNDLFCSRFGDRALDLLGDLAFERGDFALAVRWWRLLALPAAEAHRVTTATLLYPGARLDLARVRAKFILARAFAGEHEQAERELQSFRGLHGAARGRLAGKEGEYAAIVEEVIRRLPAMVDDELWSTFAGSPSRNRVPPASPSPRSWADGPAWRVSLPNTGYVEPGGTLSHLAARLCYHPVIAGDRVLLANDRSVIGYHLLNGRELFHYDLPAAQKLTSSTLAPASAPRFTLTVAGDRVYARLGEQAIGPGPIRAKSFLVCLEMPPIADNGQPGQAREIWNVAAPDEAQFEGAPLVHDGFAYVASSRVENRRTKTSLHCYDAGTGKLRWQDELCDTPEFEESTTPRYRHHLLTLAADNIVYCSHAGAVVAANRLSGKQAWAVRYSVPQPEMPEKPAGSVRELCPCVFHLGRLFVAPADANRLLCLDGSSGQVVWERDRIEAVHLLGVARGRLLFSERSCLRAFGVDNGLESWRFSGEAGLGRGLMAGDDVFWPTRDAVRVLSHSDQQQLDPTQVRQIDAGNMACADGSLVVAGAAHLTGYVAPRRLLGQLQGDAAQPGATAWTFYRLAQAEADAGQLTSALPHFARAAGLSAEEKKNDVPIRTLALRQKHAVLMELARSDRQDLDQRIESLHRACAADFAPDLRVAAYLALAELCRKAGAPERAVSTYQALLRDDSLRQVTIRTAKGTYQSAAALAAGKIGQDTKRIREPVEERPQQSDLHQPQDKSGFVSLSTPLTPAWEAAAGKLLVPVCNRLSPKQVPALFFFVRNELTCRDASNGKVVWARPLNVAPTWLGLHADIVLVGGNDIVQAHRLGDGHTIWKFGVPFVSEGTPPARPGLPQIDFGPFSCFHLTSSHLVFLLNHRELFGVEVETGDVSWTQKPPGATPRKHFCSHFYVADDLVLIQSGDGKRLAFSTKGGQPLHESQGSPTPWPQAPVPVDKDRFCLVEQGRVFLFDLAAGRELWSYVPPRPLELTGAPPQVTGAGRALLAIVPRNYGYELARLDPRTGRDMWDIEEPRLVSLGDCDIHTGSSDEHAFFLAAGGSFGCWELATGKRLWRSALPVKSGRWHTLHTTKAVIAYPAAAEQPPWTWLPLGPILLGVPDARRQENQVRHLPLSIHDRSTGRVLQQLDFRVADSRLDVQVLCGRVVVAAAGKAWAVQSKP